MAFNPFNVFRRNQKILFAMLTVVVMFMFVLSSGLGGGADIFDWLPRMIGSRTRSGEVVAVIDDKKIYESELNTLDTRRRLANQYMASAGQRAAEKLRKYVFDGLNRVSTENRPALQEALAARPFYVSPQLIERVRFGMPVSQEQFSNDRERTVTHLIGQLREIVNAPRPKEVDQEFARSMQALIELDLKLTPDISGPARTHHYFTNQPNEGNRDLVEFLLWLKKADQLGIEFTQADVSNLVAGEFYKQLSVEDLREAEGELRGKRGYSSDLLKEALGDEFRARAAQAAVLGQNSLRPNGRGFDAPYDYYRF